MFGCTRRAAACASRWKRDTNAGSSALEMANAEFVKRTGVALQMDCSALDERLPAEAELVLYRILQKALNNVERHARARHVTVHLTKLDGSIQLTIKDDGIGFDPDHPANG